ncbi:TPA: hypothetical protein ACGSTW_000697 [Pseudomonas aeruginosa]
MHQGAQDQIRKKFLGILNNIYTNGALGQDSYERYTDIAKAIHKQKERYMSPEDAKGLILRYIFLLAGSHLNSEKDTLFKDILDPTVEAERFLDFIKSIPREETFYFPLPNIIIENSIELGEASSLSIEPLEKISRKESTESDQRRTYFKSKIKGYCGFTTSSVGYNMALIQFKVFIERAIAEGIFYAEPYDSLPAQVSRVASSRTQMNYAIDHVDPTGPTTTTLPLPIEISDICGKIKPVNEKKWHTRLPPITDQLREKLHYLDRIFKSEKKQIQRLKSASEWAFDSLSAERDTMQLLQLCIGLESIYGDDVGSDGLTEKLSDRCAYSLAKSHEERERIKSEFRELYKIRSKIVHGVSSQLSSDERKQLSYGRELLRHSISKEILLHSED